uniref:Uncharacterized protein LOC111113935 n=1 Tax=Crassostrea virginica TaxID=6565 RepID=A0A8B8BX31_CRAVI|nr:uncharacterized protein LOC111113935 [Crassostrea virginica]
MVIGCAGAGKTTLVKRIKGDKDLTTTSTGGIEIHSHAFKLNSDESTIVVSTDEEKVKGCLCFTPAMLEISEKNTKETSSGVKEDVALDNSNVTNTRQTQIVDKTSRSPSSTKVILSSKIDDITDVSNPGVNESNQLVDNLTAVPGDSDVPIPRPIHAVDKASSLSSYTKTTSINDEDIVVTDPEINESNETVNILTAAVDVSPNTEECYPTLEQNIDFFDCVASVNMNDLKMLSVLDFAGHSAYYACHHIFFSPRAFFILVVDMTKDLSSVATEACRKKGLIYSDWTYEDYIKYWLGSIHTYSSREAPVIVALSHAEDNGADPEKAVEYFHNICRCLPQKLQEHLDEGRLFSFVKDSNKNVNDFKQCLVSTVKRQSHWGEKVPISWTKLESVFTKLKEGNKVFLFSNLLGNVLKTNRLAIDSEEDLIDALNFFNETGVILFRSEIKNIIILDVQWFVDAFKCIILDEEHVKEKRYLGDFDELFKFGLLSNTLLKKLWQNDFYQYKESLVNHMKYLDMLAELSKEMWYVPCMNKQTYPCEILNNCNVSSRLCFLFEFLPFIIYHRLVVACINNMGMKPWKRSGRMCIFHTVTILVYKDHRVLIAICDNKERPHRAFPYSIEIQINVTKPREIDTRLTSKLKGIICQNLTDLTKGISSCELYSQVGYRCRLEPFSTNQESHIIKEEKMSEPEYDCSKCSQPHIVDVGSICRFWEEKADPTDSNFEKEERGSTNKQQPNDNKYPETQQLLLHKDKVNGFEGVYF